MLFTESLALEPGALIFAAGLILPGRAPQTRPGKRPPDGGTAPRELCGARPADLDSMQDNASVTQATDVAQAVWRMVARS
ncbi:hypothetical protein MJ575_16650 [Klebsiella pneumoniae]|nr:hypothetical protein MJ575_16650 [Klebsiella pneumoniae]